MTTQAQMQTQTQPITAEALLHMPDDGFRYELVRGELKKVAPAGDEHGDIAMELGAELRNHVKANGLGKVYAAETGYKLTADPDTVRAPDVSFVSRERLKTTGGERLRGYRPAAPDLAVEVVSPSDLYTEVEEKVFEWLDGGARTVLVVNPRKETVSVYRSRTDITVLTREDTLEGGDTVPGWTLPLSVLFA